jgi:hypothetical protein
VKGFSLGAIVISFGGFRRHDELNLLYVTWGEIFFQPSRDDACLMNLLLTQVCDGGPACPALTAGEAYDNRLAGKLLSRLK